MTFAVLKLPFGERGTLQIQISGAMIMVRRITPSLSRSRVRAYGEP